MSKRNNTKTASGIPLGGHWRPTPPAILEAVRKADEGVADLQKLADLVKLKRDFTLDGRLVGDIGELLLCDDFKVLPERKAKGHAHDIVGEGKEGEVAIQVKLRRATKARIEFKYQPECLVVIQMKVDWSEWRIVYNGPGNVVHEEGIFVDPESRRIWRGEERTTVSLTFAALEKAATCLPADESKLQPKPTRK